MKKLITLILACMLMIAVHAQPQKIEGDGLIDIIGSKVSNRATVAFLSANEIKNTSGAKYSTSKNGIDMTASHDTLVAMTLYLDNPIYGKYTGKLPKGLNFSMTSADIIKKLGKPTTSYMNSGYAEYEFGNHVLTCWFENGVLRRLVISLK